MGTVFRVKCEVVENEFCPFVRGSYVMNRLTPKGMCAAAFTSIWPFANAMRHSPQTGFEDAQGQVTLSCPDGWVHFRLSRIGEDEVSPAGGPADDAEPCSHR